MPITHWWHMWNLMDSEKRVFIFFKGNKPKNFSHQERTDFLFKYEFKKNQSNLDPS